MEDNAPPKYTSIAGSGTRDWVDEIQQGVDFAFTHAALEDEVKRLRNFLTYVMCIDYKVNTSATMCAEDWEHYVKMGGMLAKLAPYGNHSKASDNERDTLRPYVLKYLHEPCKALAIPVFMAVMSIEAFSHGQTTEYGYEGGLNTMKRSMKHLAVKVHMDRTIMIPRVVASTAEQAQLQTHLAKYIEVNFKILKGIESSFTSDDPSARFDPFTTVTYVLTEAGKKFNDERQRALSAAAAQLSPLHWTERVQNVLQRMMKRIGPLSKDEPRWTNPHRVGPGFPPKPSVPPK